MPLEWGRAVLIYDAPEKIENGRSATVDLMIPALLAAMGVPERRLDIVTPYFVISKAWSDVFASWTARGVELRILTRWRPMTRPSPMPATWSAGAACSWAASSSSS